MIHRGLYHAASGLCSCCSASASRRSSLHPAHDMLQRFFNKKPPPTRRTCWALHSATFCTLLPDVSCGPWTVEISALAGALTGSFVVPLFFTALCCCGFGLPGVIAGSCAAACQTPFTVTGGCFATLQSCGALGCSGGCRRQFHHCSSC